MRSTLKGRLGASGQIFPLTSIPFFSRLKKEGLTRAVIGEWNMCNGFGGLSLNARNLLFLGVSLV